VAAHRAKLGLTQQELAERVGISRVAVSHLESGVTDPGERTVTLLAGLFKLEPHQLVAGTTYPAAKADRLPVVVARYTEVELQLALLDADLTRIDAAGLDVGREGTTRASGGRDPHEVAAAVVLLEQWQDRLRDLGHDAWDGRERRLVAEAVERVGRDLTQLRARRGPATRPAGRPGSG
jgi:transcriptional regulator with XRE-family HTH domain